MTSEIHQDIPSSPEFDEFLSRLHTNIREYVQEVEHCRKEEHSAFLEREATRQKQELDAQYRADLQKMTEEEAAKRQAIEKEKMEILRQQEEDKRRHCLELDQNKAQFEAHCALQKQTIEMMKQASEKQARDSQALFERFQADVRESQQRMENQMQEERRLQAEREEAMRRQITQLASRSPIVIETDSGGCNVA
jgi:hypothetical protein